MGYNNIHHFYQQGVSFSFYESSSSHACSGPSLTAVEKQQQHLYNNSNNQYSNNNILFSATTAAAMNNNTSSPYTPVPMIDYNTQYRSTSFLPSVSSVTTTQPHYQHYEQQPWKLGRATNELMLAHDIVVPSSTNTATNYYHQRNESSLSVDSAYPPYNGNSNMYNSFDNNSYYYASPSLSTSSSSTSTSICSQGLFVSSL